LTQKMYLKKLLDLWEFFTVVLGDVKCECYKLLCKYIKLF